MSSWARLAFLLPIFAGPLAISPAGAATFTSIYSFGGMAGDGHSPEGELRNVSGTLYGTTFRGGSADSGAVFSLSPSGTESLIYSFSGQADGAFPSGGLLYRSGSFYLTTERGGSFDAGTADQLSLTGSKTVLHSFGATGDGVVPVLGTPVQLGKMGYVTTTGGGQYNGGTVCSISQTGVEKVLHSFSGPDGLGPKGSLINVSGTLFGTTQGGGSYNRGTVFSITPAGIESVLWNL